MKTSRHALSAIVCTLIISCSTIFSNAQNLVVNPSFENTNTDCANFGGESFRADLNPSWDNANTNIPGDSCSSPDLFSACNLFAVGMPSSILGWQYAHTGTRYAGLILYEAPFGIKDNYREYIQGHTTTPLVAGQTYCVSFYVSLGDAVQYASENIGIWFTNSHYQRDACVDGALINKTPQLTNNCGVLMDTMNWVRLQWDYVATGGEQYFVIGNFKDKNNTPIHNAYGSAINPYAYYFIDDVSITANSCCYAEIDPATSPCINDTPFNLTVNGASSCTGPTPPGTWSGPGITDATNGTFDPSVAGVGTHTVQYTLNCGYVATQDITVKGCSMSVCQDNTGNYVVSNGTGPYTWSEWKPASSVTITDEASCTACGGTWMVGSCFSSFPIPLNSCTIPAGYDEYATGSSVAPSTNFPVIVVDATGDTLTINDASEISPCTTCPTILLTETSSTDATCGNSNGSATVSASGGAGPYTYTWQPGNLSGASQSGLSAQDYTITAADINGCDTTLTITIGNSGGPTVTTSIVQNVSCNGTSDGSATANVTGGASPYNYAWDDGETSATATALDAGSHSVTITDGSGCTVTKNVTITEPAVISVNITNTTDASCGNNDGAATASATGGTGTLSYQWDSNAGSQTTATASNLAANTYTVTVTDGNGCSANTTATINTTNGPTVAPSVVQNVTCNGLSDGSASANASGGTSPYTYSWDNGETTATATALNSGSHSVTVTDASGCTTTETITITEPNAIAITVSNTNDPTCGNTDGDATVTVTGGDGNYTYLWDDPAGQTTATASNLASGTYNVTVTDGNGCSATQTVNLSNVNGPNVSITSTQDVTCFGGSDGSATVSASGGLSPYTYSWSPSGGNAATATNLSAGNYTVTVTDKNGCVTSKQVQISESNQLSVTATTSPTGCSGPSGSISLSPAGGTPPYSYQWDNGEATPILSQLSSGSYHATITDANGCSLDTTFTITMTNGGLSVDAQPKSTTITAGDNVGIVVTVQGNANNLVYAWNPTNDLSCNNCPNPVASPSTSTTYMVTVTDTTTGCTGQDSILIIVNNPCGKVYIPNMFSPNHDGLNDELCVRGKCIKSYHLQIFDRWGETVFESNSIQDCWNGKYKGKALNTGVFVYKLKVVTLNGKKVDKSGNVNLVR